MKMECNCVHIYQRQTRYDPTRTLYLRNTFARKMRVKFGVLKRAIRQSVFDNDCFGLDNPVPGMTLYEIHIAPAAPNAFNFPRSQDKVAAFIEWLERMEQEGILETVSIPQLGVAAESGWTDVYIKDSYKRGVMRARAELKKQGMDIPPIDPDQLMMGPFHADRLGLLYTRTFQGLKGITSQMENQIGQVLAQGLADGDNPRLLARKLLATIDGKGIGELGITDTLGRFIPAERRAEMLARTEIIRAHASGSLQEMKNWAVEGVTAEVEFTDAGYNVCPRCQALDGKVFTIEESWNIIPVHPHCRCAWLPVVEDD